MLFPYSVMIVSKSSRSLLCFVSLLILLLTCYLNGFTGLYAYNRAFICYLL